MGKKREEAETVLKVELEMQVIEGSVDRRSHSGKKLDPPVVMSLLAARPVKRNTIMTVLELCSVDTEIAKELKLAQVWDVKIELKRKGGG